MPPRRGPARAVAGAQEAALAVVAPLAPARGPRARVLARAGGAAGLAVVVVVFRGQRRRWRPLRRGGGVGRQPGLGLHDGFLTLH